MYFQRHQSIVFESFFKAFGFIYYVLHYIGSVFVIQCTYSTFQCILMYLKIFEYIWIYFNVYIAYL
jgi:hypothetical protein